MKDPRHRLCCPLSGAMQLNKLLKLVDADLDSNVPQRTNHCVCDRGAAWPVLCPLRLPRAQGLVIGVTFNYFGERYAGDGVCRRVYDRRAAVQSVLAENLPGHAILLRPQRHHAGTLDSLSNHRCDVICVGNLFVDIHDLLGQLTDAKG